MKKPPVSAKCGSTWAAAGAGALCALSSPPCARPPARLPPPAARGWHAAQADDAAYVRPQTRGRPARTEPYEGKVSSRTVGRQAPQQPKPSAGRPGQHSGISGIRAARQSRATGGAGGRGAARAVWRGAGGRRQASAGGRRQRRARIQRSSGMASLAASGNMEGHMDLCCCTVLSVAECCPNLSTTCRGAAESARCV